MGQSGAKGHNFRSYVKKNIIPLQRNLYINPADPYYYEKIIQYIDRNSPEAHFHLAQNCLQLNDLEKAIYHFNQCIQTNSRFYYKAKSILERLPQPEQLNADVKNNLIRTYGKQKILIFLSGAVLGLLLMFLYIAFIVFLLSGT
ncbi:tetratricopeptide repeat protein [Paenibacillus alkalitolerans]|uniref:tetratricopeptide repeat protein n=1 Tax=Paenibacillus alkalitolerans TaxID=2799335 RepID=UPI0018F6EC88|nr:tetratricopeptide repeat protein [Paenibacillus alkalitolerans]